MTERRVTIDKEDLKQLLAEVLDEKHQCVFSHDDTHDLRVLLDMYRETTSTMRRWVIRGLIILLFGGLIVMAAIKGGLMKG